MKQGTTTNERLSHSRRVSIVELFAELATAPRLPGALCAGHADLFDPTGPEDDDTDTAERLSFAIRACWCCPALTACRSWVDSLPPKERPSGVVAGRVHGGTRPKISGVPLQSTRDERRGLNPPNGISTTKGTRSTMTDRETNAEDLQAAEFLKATLAENLPIQLQVGWGVAPTALIRVFRALFREIDENRSDVVERLEHHISRLIGAQLDDDNGDDAG
jgi:WhiB family redox-sensing transcriptional regulator